MFLQQYMAQMQVTWLDMFFLWPDVRGFSDRLMFCVSSRYEVILEANQLQQLRLQHHMLAHPKQPMQVPPPKSLPDLPNANFLSFDAPVEQILPETEAKGMAASMESEILGLQRVADHFW